MRLADNHVIRNFEKRTCHLGDQIFGYAPERAFPRYAETSDRRKEHAHFKWPSVTTGRLKALRLLHVYLGQYPMV